MVDLKTLDPSSLPSMPLSDRKRLPCTACIYFVLSSESIQYVGRSKNLRVRWSNHNQARHLDSESRIAWLNVDDCASLPDLESTLIERFKPPLNERGKDGRGKKIFFTPTQSAMVAIQKLQTPERSVSQIINTAVLLYAKIEKNRREGGALYIERPDGKREKLILIY